MAIVGLRIIPAIGCGLMPAHTPLPKFDEELALPGPEAALSSSPPRGASWRPKPSLAPRSRQTCGVFSPGTSEATTDTLTSYARKLRSSGFAASAFLCLLCNGSCAIATLSSNQRMTTSQPMTYIYPDQSCLMPYGAALHPSVICSVHHNDYGTFDSADRAILGSAEVLFAIPPHDAREAGSDLLRSGMVYERLGRLSRRGVAAKRPLLSRSA